MLETLYALGITPSKSRPRVSNDNPYAESLFKTLKYVPNFQPQGFASLTEARLWVKNFVEWYNYEHRHSGIHYVTPAQRHNGEDKEILAKRKEVYNQAKEKHPEHNKKHCQKNSRRNVLRQAYFDNAFQRIISSITYSACVACSTKIRRISSYSPSPFITQVTGKPAASNRLLQESELAPAISLVA